MSYKILSSNPRRSTHHFFVDTVEDLQQLPKEPASTALVAIPGDTYICNNNKEWILFNNIDEYSQNDFNINVNDIIQELFNSNEAYIVFEYMSNTENFLGYEIYYPNVDNIPYIKCITPTIPNVITTPIGATIILHYDYNTISNFELYAAYQDIINGNQYDMSSYSFSLFSPNSFENSTTDSIVINLPTSDEIVFSNASMEQK